MCLRAVEFAPFLSSREKYTPENDNDNKKVAKQKAYSGVLSVRFFLEL